MTEEYKRALNFLNIKKNNKLRKRQILIARTKLIIILALSIFCFVFIFSTALGAISQENEQKIESDIETSVTTIDNQDITTDIQTSITTTTASKTPEQKRAELEAGYSFEQYNKNCDWSMRIVNPYNPLPKDYTVNTTDFEDFNVDVRMFNQLKSMVEAARNSGLTLWLSSAYRSNESQASLFEEEISYYTTMGYSEEQAKQLAQKSVAIPGTSEHEMGLAVDFNTVSEDFKYTPEYAWLSEHAAEYGFIERYAEEKQSITHIIYEPWHYRYVGKENAMKIKESGYCLEEYVYYNLINE